ncbi:glycosyltransferase involved in cell wall biosynthesis [Acholeplasma morum]|uniref:glycosyltransferase family 2 protein n=1 Tax=Paracholeplasma morum TaxID=264637 RepID=UPI00195E5B18|nr:glycosyltransferase family 2 protein [Paracholeplasma morum]MBM7453032.1 glycosyltransferase involved in cell wall biosynthesis [Paracholeplasma morum]
MITDECLVSIIIPVYNSGTRVLNLIDDLERQMNLNMFEVLFIDDCSKDNSVEILEQGLSKVSFKHSVIMKKNNDGPGETRNIGICKSKGNYITFIDADDRISSDFMSIIVNAIRYNENKDIYCFDARYVNRNNKTIKMYAHSEYINRENASLYMNTSTWGKVVKADLLKLNGIRFTRFFRGEDQIFWQNVISISESFYYEEKCIYYYEQNDSSLTKNKGIKVDFEETIKKYELSVTRAEDNYKIKIFVHRFLFLIAKSIQISKKTKNRVSYANINLPFDKKSILDEIKVSKLSISKKIICRWFIKDRKLALYLYFRLYNIIR